jgi:hypothetical protein
VFVLSQPTERTLETWAVDRSYFMIEPGDVHPIRIDRGRHHLTLEPAGPAARDAGGSSERFEVVRRALAEARTEGLVHLGAPHKEEGFDRPIVTLTMKGAPPTIVSIGRGDVWRDTSVFYVRREGIDATFAIAQSKLRPIVDLR